MRFYLLIVYNNMHSNIFFKISVFRDVPGIFYVVAALYIMLNGS